MLHKGNVIKLLQKLLYSYEASKRRPPRNGRRHCATARYIFRPLHVARGDNRKRKQARGVVHARVSILGVHTSSLFNWDLRGRVPYAASSRAPKASPGDHVDVGTSSRKGLAFDGTEP